MSQQQTWTPEPWVTASGLWDPFRGHENSATHPSVYVNDFGGGILYSSTDDERARYCVNALAGIPDPAAFVRAVDELLRCESIYELNQKWEPLRLARGEVRK